MCNGGQCSLKKKTKNLRKTEGLPDDVTIYHLSLKNKTTGLESQKQLEVCTFQSMDRT